MFQEMFQKSILEKCCAVVKRYWWHMEEILTQVFKKE